MRHLRLAVITTLSTLATVAATVAVAPAGWSAPVRSGSIAVSPNPGDPGEQVLVSGRIGPRSTQRVSLQRKVDGSFRTLTSKKTTRTGAFSFSTSLPSGPTAVSYRVLSPKQSGQPKAYVTPTKQVTITEPAPPPTAPDVSGSAQMISTSHLSGSSVAAISADGTTVVFPSSAPDLAPGDTNGVADYFAWDRGSDELTLIPGRGAASSLDPASMSDTGDVVVYPTLGDNSYAWNRGSATSEAESVGGWYPSTSSDGRFVVSQVLADLMLVDRTAPNAPANFLTSGNAHSTEPSISGDGQVVAFQSSATNLTPTDPGDAQTPDVFVWRSGSIERAPVTGWADQPAVSRDGSSVVFTAGSGDPGDLQNIYRWDLTTGGIEPITQGNGNSISPAVSSDGRYVAFTSRATDLVPGENADRNQAADLFRWDMATDRIERLTYGDPELDIQPNSYRPSISGDGRFVAFDAAPGVIDADAGGFGQVYLWDALG